MSILSVAKKFVKNNHQIENLIRKVNNSLPVRLKLPKEFWDWYTFLEQSEWWDEKRIQEYQIEQIRQLVDFAYNNIPYFNQTLQELGLYPKSIHDFTDVRRLPFSDRHLFIERFHEFVPKNRQGCVEVHTSGTTGNPLVFYQDRTAGILELASIYHLWRRVGYKPGEKRVLIRGDILGDEKPYEYLYGYEKGLRLSPNKFAEDRTRLYIQMIAKYDAKYLHGYPSAISLFAKTVLEYKIDVPFQLKAVFLGSEPIYPWQRQVIEQAFHTRVYSHYGCTEQVALAGECEKSTTYHFIPQYSYVELDPETNEIIGTSFVNWVNPFIRHRTKDIAVVKQNHCTCQRNDLSIERVEGRQGDYLVSLDNVYIFPQAVTWIFVNVETIKDSQIHQCKDKSVEITYTPYANSDPAVLQRDIMDIRRRLEEMVGHSQIQFKQVEFIERGNRGKFRWIDSEVSRGYIETGNASQK